VGLITEEVIVTLGNMNIKYFENLGYPIHRRIDSRKELSVKRGTIITVKVEDLLKSSNAKVDVECDCCGEELKNVVWQNYLKYVKEGGKYYCKKCAKKLYGDEKTKKTKLKNGKSFKQWCLENNRNDVLDRWDYELNKIKPHEILYATKNKYYFKCPRGIHQSELKCINSFTRGQEGSMECNQCNSFAQFGIDNLGNDFLEKYWDYEKNTINPWEISHGNSIRKVWIKCQDVNYHGSYDVVPNGFIKGYKCSYCASKKVHPLDSLGKLLEDKGLLHLWSNKNKKSSFEFMPSSREKVYWKCPNGKHKDYKRSINDSNNKCNFRCPECQYSKGEEVISNYFISEGFIKISQKDFEQLIDKEKYNKNYYIPQKEFEGLVGLGGKSLFYDFYLPKYNLIIEYDGEYHFRVIKYKNESIKQAKDKFKKQQIHDMRKSKYAMDNDIQLIRIPYWEFDNIEKILERELNLQ